MIPDWLIYDELKRRREEREQRWEPERLELPLYRPDMDPPRSEAEDEDDERDDGGRGVIIIDMNDGFDLS